MHLSLGLPSHLLSLTIPKQQYKKQQQQKTAGTNHKTFLNEKSACRDGTPPPPPPPKKKKKKKKKKTKLDGNDTTTLHTIPTSCAIQVANYAQHKTLHVRSLFICAKCSIAHSTVFYRYISTMFSSNKISQHNLNFNVPYTIHTIHTMQTDPTLLWTPVSAYRQDRPDLHAQYSKYIVHCSHPQHNPLPMHINMHSQHYPPHCFPQPSAHN